MGKRIIYVETVEIGLLDIPRTLDELGYSVYKASLGINAQEYSKDSVEVLEIAIKDVAADYVISYDFVETVAEACYLSNKPYISWVYDAPQKELYSSYAQYDSNYVFVFDTCQKQRLLDIGIKNVFYSPLAIHAKKVRLALSKCEHSFNYDISFVGQLYKNDSNDIILSSAPDEIKDSLERSMEKTYLNWNGPSFHGNMEDISVSYLSAIDTNDVIGAFPFISLPFYYEAAVTSRILANRERVFILNSLAKKYDVNFFTFDKDVSQISGDVKIHEGAKYDYEVSNIYCNSKINLNISLHCIETGASQRIIDCMAAGGFILSNYQADLVDMFVPGEEIAIYHDYAELEEKISYYLEHEEERIAIAKRGQAKVLEKYDFSVAMENVMGIVRREEKNRTLPYLSIDHNELEALANKVLNIDEKEEQKAELTKVRAIYANPKYRTLISRYDNIGTFCEMLNVWNVEKDSGRRCIFDSVHSIEEAERSYHRVKFLLWRMESGIEYEEAYDYVETLYEEGISLLLIVWIIQAHLRDRESMIALYGDILSKIDANSALEVLSYGLYYCPDSKDILYNKVNLLMEFGLYEEALEGLYSFNCKDDETKAIIAELEEALGKH